MPLTNSHLAHLENAGLIRLSQMEPEVEYLFRHALIQEAAYASLLKQDRRKLHLAVGEALVQAYPDRLEEFDSLLAYHYSRAEAWDRTLRYACSAAQRAKQLYAAKEALADYELALQALTALEKTAEDDARRGLTLQRFDVLAERQGVWMLVGQFEQAQADLEAMISLARAVGDDARLSDALNGLGYLHLNTGAGEARAVLEEALEVKRRLGDQRGQADSLNTLTTLYMGLGEISLGREASKEAYRLYESVGDLDGLARSQWALGASNYEALGKYEEAIEALSQALALSRQAGNRALECGSLMMMGAAGVRLGDYETARAHLQQSLELARQIGDRPAEGWVLLYQSWIDRETRQFESSAERAHRSLTLGREVGSDLLVEYAHYSLACLFLISAQLSLALEHARQAETFTRRKSIWLGRHNKVLALLARVHLGLGQREDAQRYAREALQALEALHGQGVSEVQGTYFNCYLALQAGADSDQPETERPVEILRRARAAVLEQADVISDPQRRARFLNEVTMNREIMEALPLSSVSVSRETGASTEAA